MARSSLDNRQEKSGMPDPGDRGQGGGQSSRNSAAAPAAQSRPRSILNMISGRLSPSPSLPSQAPAARHTATQASPSRPVRRAPSLLSAAPSTRSVTTLSTVRPRAGVESSSEERSQVSNDNFTHAVARGTNYGSLSASNNANGAFRRLKKVASNASIASASRRDGESFLESRPPNTTEGTHVNSDDPVAVHAESAATRAGPVNGATSPSNTLQVPSEEGAELGANERADIVPTKRPSNEHGRGNDERQWRRRTWLGFMSSQGPEPEGEPSPNPESTPSTSKANEEVQDTQMSSEPGNTKNELDKGRRSKGKESQEGHKTGAHDRSGSLNQNLYSDGIPPNRESSDSQQAQTSSYTDTVRRLVSWGTYPDADASKVAQPPSVQQSDARGWFQWRAGDQKPAPVKDDQLSKSVDVEAAPATEAPRASADTAKETLSTENAGSNEGPKAGSFEQASFASRWIPYWSRSQVSEASKGAIQVPTGASQEQSNRSEAIAVDTTTMTPAEQYKAESLARLGAKDAILNNVTRSTWINYFGNRQTAAPPARMQQTIDEPEVMKVDFGRAAGETSADSQPKEASHRADNEMAASSDSSLKHGGTALPSTGTAANAQTRKFAKSRDETSKVPPNVHADPAPPTSRPMTPLTSDKSAIDGHTPKMTSHASVQAKHQSKAPIIANKAPKAATAQRPSLLLPSFDDVFAREPRTLKPRRGYLEKTWSYLSGRSTNESLGSQREDISLEDDQFRLPRHHDVLNDRDLARSRGCKNVRKVVVIGIHGWFSQGPLRNIFGEPTGTSIKFSTMMRNEVLRHFEDAGQPLQDGQLTSIALEADGKVSDRVDKSFAKLLSNKDWLDDILASDAIFIAAHSQGSIVATHLLARLIEQRHVNMGRAKVVLLCMCGIHNGPFQHLRGSMASYYMSAFESPAAKELFDFQNGQSPVSQLYAASLRIIVASGVKLVYIASLDDQVVPLYSALHTSASHPSILRAIFCDGAAFPRVDFLTNLLSFCVNVRNAGMHDHNLVTLLSSSVAGSLYGGAGHSLIYEEPQVYAFAVRYLLEVSSPNQYPTVRPSDVLRLSQGGVQTGVPPLFLNAAEGAGNPKEIATRNSNPYTLPWSLRGLLEDAKVRQFFNDDIQKLVRDYETWTPTTKTLKDVQFRLEPLRMVARTSKSHSLHNNHLQSVRSGNAKTVGNAKL